MYTGTTIRGSERRPVHYAHPAALLSSASRQAVREWDGINALVTFAVYLYFFSIPFEIPDRAIPLEVTTITGYVLLLAALTQAHVCYRLPPAPIGWFLLYLPFYALPPLLLEVDHQGEVLRIVLAFSQLLALSWVLCNVLRSPRLARNALLLLAAGCVVLGLFQILGIGRTLTETGSGAVRMSVFGQNPNSLARTLGIGALALMGLAYEMEPSALRPRLLAWPLFAVIGVAMVQSGSRMGLLALGGGFLAFTLRSGPVWPRVRNTLMVVVAIAVGVSLAAGSETMASRVERTVSEGSLAKRELIYPEAWNMFLERPVLGWGAVSNRWELGQRLADPDHPSRDTHNLLLELLTATGFLGTIPFLIGMGLSVAAAWRARAGSQGSLPLAMTVALLIANGSGNLIGQKLHWLVLAYAIASGARTVARQRPTAASERLWGHDRTP